MGNPFISGDSAIRSLNRARIVGLPGVNVDPGVAGENGYELLSAKALRLELLAAQAELALDPAAPDLVRRFDRCFDNPAAHPRAVQIAWLYGRRLGYLLLMLHRGDEVNRQARPEWSNAHWAFWKGIQRVWVGGGMVSGQLGRHALIAAQELLVENGVAGLEVAVSPYAAQLPLVGLARSAPLSVSSMLALDFGQTAVKRALAKYGGGQVLELRLLPPTPSVCEDIFQTEHTYEQVFSRWQKMLALIVESWAASSPPAAIGISLACYLIQGHPSPHDRGCYGSLQMLSPHLASFIQAEITARLGEPVPVVLLHDGTAAAAAYAGAEDAVVITLGTAIGSGFPPSAIGHWPLAPGFHIQYPEPHIQL